MTVTIAEHGFSEEAAEKCLDALMELFPASGPVITQNTVTGNLSLTIGLDATDPWAATNLGGGMIAASLNRAQLPVTPVLDVCVTTVEKEDSTEDVRELVGAR